MANSFKIRSCELYIGQDCCTQLDASVPLLFSVTSSSLLARNYGQVKVIKCPANSASERGKNSNPKPDLKKETNMKAYPKVTSRWFYDQTCKDTLQHLSKLSMHLILINY